MRSFRVRLTGRGSSEIAAYGVADAEHQVEKEIVRLWPGANVEITGLRRPEGNHRIAEVFRVEYRVRGEVEVKASSSDQARRHALRQMQTHFGDSRYRRTEWEQPAAREVGRSDAG